MISAFTASLPQRINILKKAVYSMLPQVDRMQVVLNHMDFVPGFLEHPKITVKFSDNRYFDGSRFIDIDDAPEGYVIVFDDDIIYPSDYVETLISHVQPEMMVAPMGKILKPRPITSYYKDISLSLRTFDEVKAKQVVDVPGACGILWHNTEVKVSINDFPIPNSDVCLARFCKDNKVAPVVIPHTADWLKSIWHEAPKNAPSIYGTYRNNDKIITDFINEYL